MTLAVAANVCELMSFQSPASPCAMVANLGNTEGLPASPFRTDR